MKPKGIKKRPNEYDHAQGCPLKTLQEEDTEGMDEEYVAKERYDAAKQALAAKEPV